MAKIKLRTTKAKPEELNSVYLLKMAVYLVLGSLWIRLGPADANWVIPIPFGFIVGLLIASKERFQIDRKLEYAILLVVMFLGFWLPIGLSVKF